MCVCVLVCACVCVCMCVCTNLCLCLSAHFQVLFVHFIRAVQTNNIKGFILIFVSVSGRCAVLNCLCFVSVYILQHDNNHRHDLLESFRRIRQCAGSRRASDNLFKFWYMYGCLLCVRKGLYICTHVVCNMYVCVYIYIHTYRSSYMCTCLRNIYTMYL